MIVENIVRSDWEKILKPVQEALGMVIDTDGTLNDFGATVAYYCEFRKKASPFLVDIWGHNNQLYFYIRFDTAHPLLFMKVAVFIKFFTDYINSHFKEAIEHGELELSIINFNNPRIKSYADEIEEGDYLKRAHQRLGMHRLYRYEKKEMILDKEKLNQLLHENKLNNLQLLQTLHDKHGIELSYKGFNSLINNHNSWKLVYAYALCDVLNIKIEELFKIQEQKGWTPFRKLSSN